MLDELCSCLVGMSIILANACAVGLVSGTEGCGFGLWTGSMEGSMDGSIECSMGSSMEESFGTCWMHWAGFGV